MILKGLLEDGRIITCQTSKGQIMDWRDEYGNPAPRGMQMTFLGIAYHGDCLDKTDVNKSEVEALRIERNRAEEKIADLERIRKNKYKNEKMGQWSLIARQQQDLHDYVETLTDRIDVLLRGED